MAKRKVNVIEVKYPADVITPEQRAAYDAQHKPFSDGTRRNKRRKSARVSALSYPAYFVTAEQRAAYDAYNKQYSLRGVDEVAFFALQPGETEIEKSSRLLAYPGILPGESDSQRLVRLAAAEKEAYDRRPLSTDELIWLRKNVLV